MASPSKKGSRPKRAKPPGFVFVSYAHEDIDRVRSLVNCLTKAKLNVWWDRGLKVGQPWSRVLQEKLWEASCVLVVWSRASVKSLFVRAEARERLDSDDLEKASREAVLVGVKIDKIARLPLPFGELQYLDLAGWQGTPCSAMRPVASVARKLVRRNRARSYWPLDKDSVQPVRQAAAGLRRLTSRIDALSAVLVADHDAAADLCGVLTEVHRTYDAVVEAVEAFVTPALSVGALDARVYAKFERGSLKKLIRDGRGHCDQIAHIYGRRDGLRDWLVENTTPAKVKKADAAIGRLAIADDDLFRSLADIGQTLTNESRAIVNLMVAGQHEAARKRIASGRKKLAPLEKELEQGIRQLQNIEQKLGYVGTQG